MSIFKPHCARAGTRIVGIKEPDILNPEKEFEVSTSTRYLSTGGISGGSIVGTPQYSDSSQSAFDVSTHAGFTFDAMKTSDWVEISFACFFKHPSPTLYCILYDNYTGSPVSGSYALLKAAPVGYANIYLAREDGTGSNVTALRATAPFGSWAFFAYSFSKKNQAVRIFDETGFLIERNVTKVGSPGVAPATINARIPYSVHGPYSLQGDTKFWSKPLTDGELLSFFNANRAKYGL